MVAVLHELAKSCGSNPQVRIVDTGLPSLSHRRAVAGMRHQVQHREPVADAPMQGLFGNYPPGPSLVHHGQTLAYGTAVVVE